MRRKGFVTLVAPRLSAVIDSPSSSTTGSLCCSKYNRSKMADHAAGEDIFVYTGGRAPLHVVNAIIDESVEEIDDGAFRYNEHLKSVVCHDGVLKVGEGAFTDCSSLQRVKMSGVRTIEEYAFYSCEDMTHVEFNKLETIGRNAFGKCTSLQLVKLPTVKTIGQSAFIDSGVQDAEFGEDLETIGIRTFWGSKLRRISIPLRDGMFQLDDIVDTYTQFLDGNNLTTVELVRSVNKTVASLHFESRRNEMNAEIQRINQILPGTDPDEKADVIIEWIRSVISRFERYKAEHRAILKEATILLELALWEAKIDDFKVEDGRDSVEERAAKKAKIDVDEARKEAHITSGADIIIKNVLPYLKME